MASGESDSPVPFLLTSSTSELPPQCCRRRPPRPHCLSRPPSQMVTCTRIAWELVTLQIPIQQARAGLRFETSNKFPVMPTLLGHGPQYEPQESASIVGRGRGWGRRLAEGDILSRCRRDEASERAELCRRWEEVGEPWTQSWPCHTSSHWNVLRPEQAGALQDTALSPQKSEAKWGPGVFAPNDRMQHWFLSILFMKRTVIKSGRKYGNH